ncbi:MAG: hypothetical protein HC893_07185 [Chloroflexaceae bacterium]|nr:hypothetical protein [Chloroflexaceae bacterium]
MLQMRKYSPELDSSNRLLMLLEQCCPDIPAVHDALERHTRLHHQLEMQNDLHSRALAEWQLALERRWRWEVAAQRIYIRIQHMIRDQFGSDSPQSQALTPAELVGTADEMLRELRRLYATLLVCTPVPISMATLQQLGDARDNLAMALAETQRCKRAWRQVMLEHRMILSAYQRAFEETQQELGAFMSPDVSSEMAALAFE